MASQAETAAASNWSTAASTLTRLSSGMNRDDFSGIARQSSIYSLTLEEFQNTLGEPGKSFGSMNMDEFLKTIWTAEESEAMAAAMGAPSLASSLQQGLQRQGSLSLPRTLSRKTVEDVWKDISRKSIMDAAHAPTAEQERQMTFGEMTLEDFLVKAGVVREDSTLQAVLGGVDNGLDFGAADKNGERVSLGDALDSGFGITGRNEEKPKINGSMPLWSLSTAFGGPSKPAAMESLAQLDAFKHASPATACTDWLGNTHQARSPMVVHNGMLQQQCTDAFGNGATARAAGNGAMVGSMGAPLGAGSLSGVELGVGLGAAVMSPVTLALKTASPSSPLSDGHGALSALSSLPYSIDGCMRGRKRGLDGSLEKVVERRQKRMIKNRESAARSRARKQAYTVELEAEVSQLKEENMRLRRQELELAEQRKKQFFEVPSSLAPCQYILAQKPENLRRTLTGPW